MRLRWENFRWLPLIKRADGLRGVPWLPGDLCFSPYAVPDIGQNWGLIVSVQDEESVLVLWSKDAPLRRATPVPGGKSLQHPTTVIHSTKGSGA